ncbi:unnamed protein product [Polarella glacialis]|uniref:ABM domain-containing protein n=1 Tax=Polarella glacialis TaxID=89957 RepID=A0A813DSN2_POLGL|nr:unnamed protein product [Polarella glacialis]
MEGEVLGPDAAVTGPEWPSDVLDTTGAPHPESGLQFGCRPSTQLLLYVRITLQDEANGAALQDIFRSMAVAERPGGPGTPGGTLGYTLWQDEADRHVWHKFELFADAGAAGSVFALPEVPDGLVRTSQIVAFPTELSWLGEGHKQPLDAPGERYSAVVSWWAKVSEEGPEPFSLESSALPASVVILQFLEAIDAAAALRLEIAAKHQCVELARIKASNSMRLASLHRSEARLPGSAGFQIDRPRYVWLTVEHPGAEELAGTLSFQDLLPAVGSGVMLHGFRTVALTRNYHHRDSGVFDGAIVGRFVAGYLPTWG